MAVGSLLFYLSLPQTHKSVLAQLFHDAKAQLVLPMQELLRKCQFMSAVPLQD